jgi:hypothetical protein
MGIRIVRGRGLEWSDVITAPRVVVVSQALANRLWPGEDPLGHRFVSEMRPMEVVGVAADAVYRSATDRDPRPVCYVPLTQSYEARVTLHVRTNGDPLAMLPAVREVVHDADPQLAVVAPRRLIDEFERSTAAERTMAALTGALGAIALLLAGVGLYGVMAYTAKQRTTEVGLRLALGATPLSILRLLLNRGVRLLALGVVIGVAGAVAGGGIVRAQLFGVEPTDFLTWVTVSLLLVAVGLAACAIPAVRAMRVDPMVALRTS